MANRPSGYRILDYGDMVTCEPRMHAYAEALRRAVTPGCTVFDLGAGPGVFSVLACQYGAGTAVAIEPDESVELVRQIARTNGYEDKISVFKGSSSDYSPSVKADVIISDLRGALPLYRSHIAAISDARERLLARGGTLIPARDRLRIALAGSDEEYRRYEQPWLRNNYDLDLSAGYRFAANTSRKVNLKAGVLLSDATDLAVLDYNCITSPDVVSDFALVAKKRGTAHGLLLWFDAELADEIGFSNAPGQPELVYGQTFFPFERSVDLERGDRVTGEVGAREVDGAYVWTWRSSFQSVAWSGLFEFRQSTFLSSVIAPDALRSKSSNFAPPPRVAYELDRFCLSLLDGQRTLGMIAAEVQAKFPERFPNAKTALDHVTRLASRYDDMGTQI